MRSHKAKIEAKKRAHKDLEKTILRDIQLLKTNLSEKLSDLIEQRGSDLLDDVFYEMRDDEELKFENTFELAIDKSAVAKKLKLRFQVALQMPERKRNTEIQTYNVDFLID